MDQAPEGCGINRDLLCFILTLPSYRVRVLTPSEPPTGYYTELPRFVPAGVDSRSWMDWGSTWGEGKISPSCKEPPSISFPTLDTMQAMPAQVRIRMSISHASSRNSRGKKTPASGNCGCYLEKHIICGPRKKWTTQKNLWLHL